MAVPIFKKRKLSHSPSEDDDSASFASFGDSSDEEQSGTVVQPGKTVGDELGDAGDESEDEYPEESENNSLESDEVQVSNAGQNGSQKHAKPAQSRNKSHALDGAAATFTGGTFKSNMFKLQVDELLSNIRPRHGKKEAAAEAALHLLKDTIEGIPAREPMTILDAERDLIKKSRVAIPFPEPRPPHDAKYKMEYQKPSSINVVGSYALKIAARTRQTLMLDMMLTMPASLFQDKDYLNHRYFYKRAHYLACVAGGLRKALGDKFALDFESSQGNPLTPVIVVRPKKGEQDWQINILPSISDKVFANEKLLPSKNCVRPHGQDGAENATRSLPSTPFYNSSVQADAQVAGYLKLLHNASAKCEAFKDACLLGRIWLRQRGLGSEMRHGGFGGFEFAALVSILLSTGGPSGAPALSIGYSSYQLFKATLQYLAVKDMVKQPIVLEAGNVQLPSEDGVPILFDGPRSHNLLYKMAPWSYKQLRAEARTTLSMLGETPFDQFENTFIVREDAAFQKYDCVLTLPTRTLSPEASNDHEVLQHSRHLNAVLLRGLGDRVFQIVLTTAEHVKWDFASARPSSWRNGELVVALTVNPANAARAVDHGPSAESKKAGAEFRAFWGEKAELRRFRDGSILESLVWSAQDGGPSIIQQIVSYLLGRHFGDTASESAVFKSERFARLIRSPETAPFQPILEAFKTLENDIRSMEGLPLTVRHIMATDTQLRYASALVPLTAHQKLMKTAANVVVQFEGSTRWPDDLIAVQKTKIAFLLKLSELFQETNPNITSRVGLENAGINVLNQGFLDIIYQNGAAFRIRIHHDREQTLIDRTLKDKTSDPKTRECAALALAAYKRDFVKTPAHTAAVQKLCTRHPALSSSIRLTKKWFSSHLLHNHFPAELIELFVIRTFTQPWPWTVPSSAQTGFLRTLAFLARWDWRADPLIIDVDNDLKAADVAAMTTRFEAWRKLDPSLNRIVLFAASSIDPEGIAYTDGSVSKVVAGRMTALARAATNEVLEKDLELDPAALFVSPLGDFDFLLHLNPAFVDGDRGAKKAKKTSAFKNLVVAEVTDTAVVDLDPVGMFLDELNELYGSSLMLFYGGREGDVVAGLWSPLSARRIWKVNLAYSTVPIKGDDGEGRDAEINKSGILGEIARLGGDLIERIDVNRRE